MLDPLLSMSSPRTGIQSELLNGRLSISHLNTNVFVRPEVFEPCSVNCVLRIGAMDYQILPGRIAVIDVETTGLNPFRHDRIVEMAAVILSPECGIEREFASLVNPDRDIGPSQIHGLTSADILHAPRFAEIAGEFLETVSGTIAIAGHNIRFDRQFLQYEFERAGHSFPDCPEICTMRLSEGGTLPECCDAFGVPFEGTAHEALFDARATARLLVSLLTRDPGCEVRISVPKPIRWPESRKSGRLPVSRSESRRRRSEPPTYLQRLLARVDGPRCTQASDGAILAYRALLDRVLEDRHVDSSEADAILDMAIRWGLTAADVRHAHQDYLSQLAVAAVLDGIVTASERRDLEAVSALLGLDPLQLDRMLDEATAIIATSHFRSSASAGTEPGLGGKSVCFTGELTAKRHGQLISREQAESLAQEAGLSVRDSVTRKLDLLVVADPHSQSGKAKKARQYGVRILHEMVFWKSLGIEVE